MRSTGTTAFTLIELMVVATSYAFQDGSVDEMSDVGTEETEGIKEVPCFANDSDPQRKIRAGSVKAE